MRTAVILICLLFCLSGCATIVNDDTMPLSVKSWPSGADVYVNGSQYKTPATVYLKRGDRDVYLRIKKEGYVPVLQKMETSLDEVMWGNVFFGGLIGLFVDIASNKGYDYEPNEVYVFLKKVRPSASKKPPANTTQKVTKRLEPAPAGKPQAKPKPTITLKSRDDESPRFILIDISQLSPEVQKEIRDFTKTNK